MKIKLEDWHMDQIQELSEFVENELDGPYDWGDGQLEEVSRIAKGANGALGRLVVVLAEKGVLTAPEVIRVVSNYESSVAEFTAQEGV